MRDNRALVERMALRMDDYVNVGRWFSVLYRRSRQFVEEACQEVDLNFSEFSMVLRLHDMEGVRQDELAGAMFLDKAIVTRTLNSLEKKKFVYRENDSVDKRVRHIYLTDYAKSQYDHLRYILQGWVDYLVADMDEAETKMIFKGFSDLVDRVREADIIEIAQKVQAGGEVHEKI